MPAKKKAYQKPELNQIDLKSEEIFLTNCKLTSGSIATRARTISCSTQTRCATTLGSS